jgi:hypothetical protein
MMITLAVGWLRSRNRQALTTSCITCGGGNGEERGRRERMSMAGRRRRPLHIDVHQAYACSDHPLGRWSTPPHLGVERV